MIKTTAQEDVPFELGLENDPCHVIRCRLDFGFDGENMYMGMNDNAQEFLSANQTYNSQNENNEDYEIPPITPPNLPDPSLLHLVDHEAGYHSLCHSLPPNSLIPAYPYQNMDLPAIMVSNMLSQDGHLLSSQLPTVSAFPLSLPFIPPTLCAQGGGG
ncbi:hypothetical protein DUI87_27700 [Hirundo rustica rustica]|uniref:TOX high mobility group box family member 2 n=1 Tax=Hirundo rustica rustica TaxID=333673 RepID=A0A3M0J5G6_HIRRU|nr:hypothetical protein DUI87_27700 [Hirundo rustica rustica]